MKFIIISLSFISIALFLTVQIPPNETFWFLGFLSPCVPAALLILGILLLYSIAKKSWLIAFPLLALVFGYQFIPRTINFSSAEDSKGRDFSLISYNVSGFMEAHVNQQTGKNTLMEWVIAQDADVYSFQEFANDDKSETENFVAQLEQHYPYYNFSSIEDDRTFGVAIFSKYPIIDEGEILFRGKEFNRAAYADIVIEDDTARIISIHMESMQLKRAQTLGNNKKEKVKQSMQYGYYKMKEAFIERSYQADTMLSFIQTSPHPVIITGDFNQTPYSYVYNSFAQKLSNAFTSKGNGFGFTYTGNKLFFLRIDHHFYDPSSFNILEFNTHKQKVLSDHYPIEGFYQFK